MAERKDGKNLDPQQCHWANALLHLKLSFWTSHYVNYYMSLLFNHCSFLNYHLQLTYLKRSNAQLMLIEWITEWMNVKGAQQPHEAEWHRPYHFIVSFCLRRFGAKDGQRKRWKNLRPLDRENLIFHSGAGFTKVSVKGHEKIYIKLWSSCSSGGGVLIEDVNHTLKAEQ